LFIGKHFTASPIDLPNKIQGTTTQGNKMQKDARHDHISYLDLSIEALWIARVIQDGLDILLAGDCYKDAFDSGRITALRVNRDVFERLGIFGCSAYRINPRSSTWSAASRVELIRQVSIHWRAFIDATYGTPWGSELILSLTDQEVRLLDHIQRLGHTLQINTPAMVYCMQQEVDHMALRQKVLRTQLCLVYMEKFNEQS
jgi:hypothetical protein